jgi:hypothetical protein
MSKIGTYDPNWDHRSVAERRADDRHDLKDEYLRVDAKERIAKRDYFDRFYDALSFIEDRGLKDEFEEWLVNYYVNMDK